MTGAPPDPKSGPASSKSDSAPRRSGRSPKRTSTGPKAEAASADSASPKKAPARKRSVRSKRAGRGASTTPPWLQAALRTRSLLAAAAILIGLPAIVLVGFSLTPASGNGRTFEIEWKATSSASQAAEQLAQARLVRSALLMSLYLRLTGGASDIPAGIHLVQDNLTPRVLLRRLERIPTGATVRLSVPEGFNKFDIAKRLQDKGICSSRAFLTASSDITLLRDLRLPATDVEGFLFPATYEFQRNDDPQRVMRRMVSEADRRHGHLFESNAPALDHLKDAFHWSRREVLILASVIEKEAAVDDERPLIASVFFNRLTDPDFKPARRLQSDPTARYGCLLQPNLSPTCAGAEQGVTGPMVRDPANPYSTYAHSDLPPGPICNPSERSIQAVLQPATTRYFYFFAQGNGRHTFSETYEEHKGAIRDRIGPVR